MSDVSISWKDLFVFNYVIQLPHFLRLPTDLQLGNSHPEKLWCYKKKSNYSLGKPLVKVDLQRMHRNKLPYFVCLTIKKRFLSRKHIYIIRPMIFIEMNLNLMRNVRGVNPKVQKNKFLISSLQ